MEVCLSWLVNIRGYLVSVAIHAGLPAVALRHGFAALENLSDSQATHVSQHVQCTMYYMYKGVVHVPDSCCMILV